MELTWGGARRVTVLVALAAGCAAVCFSGTAVAATPAVVITPVGSAPTTGSFEDGEVVKVAVADNTVFTPGAKVNILECADPQGIAANLPKDISGCDGETIQGDTVLVQPGGAVSATDYTIYRLPSVTLGESPDGQPVCNSTSQCVLYVGENQEDFTQPKLFSAPFTVTAATGGATSASGTATSAASSSAPAVSSSSGEGAGDPPASLAFTGAGASLPWLAGIGGLLLVVGGAGRRWTRARS
jgi:hypothetical protein